MKKILKLFSNIFVILLLLNNTSCRKKEPIGYDFIDKPFHCYNNVLDSNENLIDKGGACGCDTVKIQSKCGLKTNQIFINNQYYNLKQTYRDTSTSGMVRLQYTFNSTDKISLSFNQNVLLNTELSVNNSSSINNNKGEIDITIITAKYNYTLIDNQYGNIRILTNGCDINLMTCKTRIYNNANPTPESCIMNIDLKLF